jgi:phosphoglycolate phosphatase-like HAD superfamily hydrolase
VIVEPTSKQVICLRNSATKLSARRAQALGVGLLSGGYGQGELERAGAYRVYEEPADLLRHLDEMGVRSSG